MTSQFPKSRYLTFFLIAISGVAIDLGSKSLVFQRLGYPGGGTGWLLRTGLLSFRLHTTFNEGALWGMGQGLTWLFASMSLVAIVGVLYWLFVHGAAVSLWLTTALGLIMAGTIGNLYDRLGLHGCIHPATGQTWYAVRDFLAARIINYDWPIFNFADVFLVTGAIMLVIQSFMAEETPPEKTAAK